jgi:hypothetical protein
VALRCHKEGCWRTPTMLVTLDAADGSDTWNACYKHAKEFQRWVMNETKRTGHDWASLEIVADEDELHITAMGEPGTAPT